MIAMSEELNFATPQRNDSPIEDPKGYLMSAGPRRLSASTTWQGPTAAFTGDDL